MDIFAHGFWTYAIYSKRKYVWHSVLFGVLPDLLSFGVFAIMMMISGNLPRGPPPISMIPGWVNMAYNLTHSIVVFGFVFLMVYLFTKKWFWPLMGWALHILIDIPTHSSKFFPTPMFWPMSNYNFDGIGWFASWFMILNYSALIIVMYFVVREKRKLRFKAKVKPIN